MKMWLRRNIWWLILLSIFMYVSYTILKVGNEKSSKVKIVTGISAEYNSLFLPKNMVAPSSYVLYNTKLSPISEFYYNNKYWIALTKLKTKESDSLPFVNIENGRSTLTENITYAGFEEGYYQFYLLPDSSRIAKVRLTINGDSIKNISKTNDLIAYSCKCKSLSVSFNNFKNNNLIIEQSLNKLLPSCIVFLKRGQSVYFIYISEAHPMSAVDPFANFNLNQILKN